MRSGVIIVGIVCSFLLLLTFTSASLSCSLTTRAGCSNTPVLYLQNDSGGYENAHAQNISVNSYAYALCCSSIFTTLNYACQSTPLFRLSNLTNAHLQFGNYSGPGSVYDVPVCLGSSAGNLTCTSYAGNCPASYHVTIGSLASSNTTNGNLTDAHFGSETKYRMKQCCFISGLTPLVSFQGQTPAQASSQTATSIIVNLSTNDSYGLHYTFTDFDNSLIGGWRMDIINGSGAVIDITGRYNASNLSGAFRNETEGSGKFGKGYAFDGTNDYLNAGAVVPGIDVVNKTISAWVRIRSNKQQSIIDKGFDTVGGYGGWSFGIQATGKLWWWAHTNKDMYDTGTALPLGNWTHVAVVWNAHTKNVTFYLNGAFNSQKQDSTIVEQSSASSLLVIGAMHNASNFFLNGELDEVLLFNRTFSATEIGGFYNASATKYYANFTNLVAGVHSFKGYAVDVTGTVNSTETRMVTIASVDSVAPLVTIVRPQNTTYTSLPIYFNVSLNENGTAWYSLNNGVTNYTMTSNSSSTGFNATNGSIADGGYTFNAYANDSAGNVNYTSSIVFSVGASEPTITLTNPGADVVYQSTSQEVSFQFTLTNTSALQNCSLFVNGSLVNSTSTPNASDGGVTLFNHVFGVGTYYWNVSCITVHGLSATSSTRLFSVTAPSSGGTGSSSGGGSGGGGESAIASTSSTNASTVIRGRDGAAFLEVPQGLSFSLFVDVQTTRTFTLKNERSTPLSLTISSEGLEEYLSVEGPITLAGGEEREITIQLKGVKEGLLTGMLVASDGSSSARIPVVLNVRSENFLFDASIVVRSEGKIVMQGDGLKAQINLLQVGPQQKVDVITTYIIKDFSGKVYLEETETFYVLKAKDFIKEFDTSQLPEGTYILGLEIQYPGAFATSSAQFEVVSPSLLSSPLLFGIVVGGLLVIGAGIIGLSLWRRRTIHHLVHRR
ncbi:LamG domain-containing protein [Candidatus Pacearchaeota archaeon]|nr:LamG domain-containing protein [Candidatus Pacearchaeota archaeon]